MKKISFKNDYSEGCHPRILEALTRTNLEQAGGYGLDAYCEEASQILRERIGMPEAKVYFVSGGTQANLLVLSSVLRPWESVVAADTAHIFTNETGAIEATGHKIHTAQTIQGKITPDGIQAVLDSHTNKPHQLLQRVVFISNATEVGTIYRREELEVLSAYCKANNLLLYMDGARLGHALMSSENDLSLSEIARLVDVFYVGGTKNGALLGEAIIMTNPDLQAGFDFNLKQKGAMLAKGRLLGIQFLELFRDNLYFDLANHANVQAMRLKAAFEQKGCAFWSETSTNQLFPILSLEQIAQLSEKFDFYVWHKMDEHHSAVRLITSWATTEDMVDQMVEAIGELEEL